MENDSAMELDRERLRNQNRRTFAYIAKKQAEAEEKKLALCPVCGTSDCHVGPCRKYGVK